jgi:hypothetical protein
MLKIWLKHSIIINQSINVECRFRFEEKDVQRKTSFLTIFFNVLRCIYRKYVDDLKNL